MKKLLLGAVLVASFSFTGVAQAATLTQPQISAILLLLKAFNVNQATINIVSQELSQSTQNQTTPSSVINQTSVVSSQTQTSPTQQPIQMSAAPAAPQFVSPPSVSESDYVAPPPCDPVNGCSSGGEYTADISWQSNIPATSEVDLMTGIGNATAVPQMTFAVGTSFEYAGKLIITPTIPRYIQILLTANGTTTVYRMTLRFNINNPTQVMQGN